MKRIEAHQNVIAFLNRYTGSDKVIQLDVARKILHTGKWAKAKLDLVQGTDSQRIYDLTIKEVKLFKSVIK